MEMGEVVMIAIIAAWSGISVYALANIVVPYYLGQIQCCFCDDSFELHHHHRSPSPYECFTKAGALIQSILIIDGIILVGGLLYGSYLIIRSLFVLLSSKAQIDDAVKVISPNADETSESSKGGSDE